MLYIYIYIYIYISFCAQRWYEQDFGEKLVRGGTALHAVFVGEQAIRCLCSWALGDACHVPIPCSALEPGVGMRET